MGKGTQKRVQPDLVQEIKQYSGGSFSEKMVKWRNDVDRLTHDEVKEVLKELRVDPESGEIRETY